MTKFTTPASTLHLLSRKRSIEQARYAASLVRVNYAPEKPLLSMEEAEHAAHKPKENHGDDVQLHKGDVEAALRNSDFIKIEETYLTPSIRRGRVWMQRRGLAACVAGNDGSKGRRCAGEISCAT